MKYKQVNKLNYNPFVIDDVKDKINFCMSKRLDNSLYNLTRKQLINKLFWLMFIKIYEKLKLLK